MPEWNLKRLRRVERSGRMRRQIVPPPAAEGDQAVQDERRAKDAAFHCASSRKAESSRRGTPTSWAPYLIQPPIVADEHRLTSAPAHL
jgi:hypothetical protein